MFVKPGTKITIVDYNNWTKHSRPVRKLALATKGGAASCYVLQCSRDGITSVLFPNVGTVTLEEGLHYTLFCEDDLLNNFIELENTEETQNLVHSFFGCKLAKHLQAKTEAEEQITKLTQMILEMQNDNYRV